MRTVRTKVYKFDELTPKAQNKAIEKLNSINVDYEWWDFLYDDFSRICEIFGIEVDLKKTYFSGFSHQGQGSAFTGSIDIVSSCKAIKSQAWKTNYPKETFSFYTVTPAIERVCKLIASGSIDYSAKVIPANRETSIKTEIDIEISYYGKCDKYTRIESAIEETRELIEDLATTLNGWFFDLLRNEYDYLTSEAAIIETLKANEYEFLKDGSLYHNNN